MVALGLALCLGCGYRPVGSGGVSSRLWVEPVEDRGDQPLFGALLAREVTREVGNRAGLQSRMRKDAEYRLALRVDSVEETAVAYSKGDIAREYLLTAHATATVLGEDEEVRWRSDAIWASRQFAAGDSVNETETNKDRALELLAGDLARAVALRVTLELANPP